MSEEDDIRQAVIDLLAAQEAGEDVSDLLPQFDSGAAPFNKVASPADFTGAFAAGAQTADAENAAATENAGADAAGTDAANPETVDAKNTGADAADAAELDTAETRAAAIAYALDIARAYSQASRLLTPTDWEACGAVPSFMTCEDLEMAVYDHLMEYQQACNLDPSLAPLVPSSSEGDARKGSGALSDGSNGTQRHANPHTHSKYSSSPGRAVGMSGFKRHAQASAEGALSAQEPEESPAASPAPSPDPSPDPTSEPPACSDDNPAAESASEPTPDPSENYPECAGIRLLMGADSYYLYDANVMTDTYARWSYLAAEDDPVAAFVECVRDESRTYPRPMAITNLANPPFRMDAEAVEAAFARALEQGRADDIERIEATNGDVYFYSTAYLTPTRAQSLAQYDAVERAFNV
ncbi:hypothetical protein AALA21_00905 [Eggerthellaceae bacterium 3-80]|nr:hypothetical protein D7W09_01410 [bacterium D16-34]